MPFLVRKAYTIKEAQRSLAAVVRTAERGDLVAAARVLGVGVPFLTARLRRYGAIR